jgi:hypothetical protein
LPFDDFFFAGAAAGSAGVCSLVSAIVATLSARERRNRGNYGKRRAEGFLATFSRFALTFADLIKSIDGYPVAHVG